MNRLRERLQKLGLFWISLPICAAVGILGIALPDSFAQATNSLIGGVLGVSDWYFILSISVFAVLSALFAASRYGDIRLGQPDEQPEFGFLSWFAMLFAAGMGSGTLLYGVAEPMIHFSTPPEGVGGTPEAARQAVVITLYHWGLHAWGVYAISGLVLAYFRYRRGTSFMPSASLRAAFTGAWIGPVAHAADLIAVLGVAFGVAASMALGTLQFEAGLQAGGLVSSADASWVRGLTLIALFACYMASASTGLNKGIKWLSQINVALAIMMLVFVLLVGPTRTLLGDFGTGFIDYTLAIPRLLVDVYPFTDKASWVHTWSSINFIWWIAWAPFVGIFIARISRGRTIREFIIGVVGAPTLFCLLWFSAFGGAAIFEDQHGAGGIAQLINENNTVALFALLERYPIYPVLMAIGLALVFIFLVTSVDSATYVLGMLTARGSHDPPTGRKLSWGFSLAVLSGAMLAAGKMDVVRSSALLGAIPFVFIIQLQVVALIRDLRRSRGE